MMTLSNGYVCRRSPSLDAFEAFMTGLLRPCRVTKRASNSYRTEVRHARVNQLGLTSVGIGGEAQIAVDAHRSLTLLQIPLEGHFTSRDRRQERHTYRAGQFAQLVHSSAPIHLEFSQSTKMLIIALNDEQLSLLGGSSVLQDAVGHECSVPIEGGAGMALCRLAAFVMDELETVNFDLLGSGLAERFEDCLVAAVGAALGQRDNSVVTRRAVPSYVVKAERFMRENLEQTVTLADIVAASGASARTLHRTFRETRGETPLGVLKNMRLDRVHLQLSRGTIAPGDITRVAMAAGFNHMGLFAADYKTRFGILPSSLSRLSRN